MKRIFIFLMLLISSSLFCQNNNDIIKGNVKDIYGEILPGVSISIINNDSQITSSISDIKGNYTLSIPDSLNEFKIVYSFIGMKEKEVKIKREKKKNEKADNH